MIFFKLDLFISEQYFYEKSFLFWKGKIASSVEYLEKTIFTKFNDQKAFPHLNNEGIKKHL